jgi:hypothetical protein
MGYIHTAFKLENLKTSNFFIMKLYSKLLRHYFESCTFLVFTFIPQFCISSPLVWQQVRSTQQGTTESHTVTACPTDLKPMVMVEALPLCLKVVESFLHPSTVGKWQYCSGKQGCQTMFTLETFSAKHYAHCTFWQQEIPSRNVVGDLVDEELILPISRSGSRLCICSSHIFLGLRSASCAVHLSAVNPWWGISFLTHALSTNF